MEDKLVTLAILTYTKAQILKNVLENEGIETYIHNVNQIQPVVSSGAVSYTHLTLPTIA